MSSIFFRIDAWVTALILMAAMLVAWRLGLLVGRRMRGWLEQTVPGGGKIEDACLALLGLLLAFSFATTYSRFDDRRQMVVKEANAISTFAARAELLSDPYRVQVRELLRDYARHRVRLVDLAHHPQDWAQWDRQTRQLQSRITALVTEAARQMPPSAVLAGIIAAMNSMNDEYEARVAVTQEHVPYAVLALLCLVSLLSAFLLGRSHGIAEKHQPLTTIVFVILVGFVVEVTLDLDQPYRGLIKVSQEPMARVAESLGVAP